MMLSPTPAPSTSFQPQLKSDYFFNGDPAVAQSPLQQKALSESHSVHGCRVCGVRCSQLPVDGLLALPFEDGVGLAEVAASEEASVRAEA